MGELEEARATWRAGLEIARARSTDHPDDRLLFMNLLVHAIVHEDPDGDIPGLLEEVHARYPGNPAIEFATAVHELTTGDPASATRRLARLVRMTEDEIVATETAYDGRMFGEWAWNALGLAALAEGNARGAAAAFRQAEAADPDNPAYRTRRQLAEARARA
jgi:predicted Zn-dependent protease